MDYFLTIDGIKGSSATKGHVGDIEISSFSFGASQSNIGSQSSGAGAGKVSINSFSIMKVTDKTSPLLMKAYKSGANIKSISLALPFNQGSLTIILQNVRVRAYSSSSSGDNPTESVSFTFQKITMNGGPTNTMVPTSTPIPSPSSTI